MGVSRLGPEISADATELGKARVFGGLEWRKLNGGKRSQRNWMFAEFEQFVLPHLSIGSRGPAPKLSFHKIFNYVLTILYLGCQWKELPIDKDGEGHPETHYTRIYRIWRRWVDDG